MRVEENSRYAIQYDLPSMLFKISTFKKSYSRESVKQRHGGGGVRVHHFGKEGKDK